MPEVTWEAPEFEYRRKDVSWYWISIIVATLFLGFAVWQKNFLFGVFIVVAEILILVWANRRPQTTHFKVHDRGIEIVGQTIYPYTDIENVSIDEKREEALGTLTIRFRRQLKPPVTINIPRERIAAVEQMLEQFVDTVDTSSSLTDDLEKFVRF